MLPCFRESCPDRQLPRRISEAERHECAWAVCGKGMSAELAREDWRGPIVGVNEAINMCRGEHRYLSRYDADSWLLPVIAPWVTAIIPESRVGLYPWGQMYVYSWAEIGLARSEPSAVLAIAIAATLGATSITLYGMDGLFYGDYAYHPELGNHRNAMPNQQARLQAQVRRFRALPASVIDICRSFDDIPLSKPLQKENVKCFPACKSRKNPKP